MPLSPSPFQAWLHREWRELTSFRPTDRPWHMPAVAALAAGLPLALGASFGRMDAALVASMGGLVFLYLPETSLRHRMLTLIVCSIVLTLCYAMGLISHAAASPPMLVTALTTTAVVVTIAARYYALAPPGSLFFVMVAAIGAYTPVPSTHWPAQIAWFATGSSLACLIAFFYSLYALRHRPAQPVLQRPSSSFDYLILEPCIIATSVGLALALAETLHLQKAYWVPVSCLAVIQGATLRAVWTRQVHRILGTTLGLLLALAVLSLPLHDWTIAALVMLFMFLIETIIVRHYAIAALFITPMAILLAEAATHGHASASTLITARFFDTILGALIGFLGGIALHSQPFRQAIQKPLRRLFKAL